MKTAVVAILVCALLAAASGSALAWYPGNWGGTDSPYWYPGFYPGGNGGSLYTPYSPLPQPYHSYGYYGRPNYNAYGGMVWGDWGNWAGASRGLSREWWYY
jgi:hypothetical protein